MSIEQIIIGITITIVFAIIIYGSLTAKDFEK